uniref:Uncharacterized protein n=1 Tax=Avena sativa TaxID=4498 RepID=A0ACD5VUJ4_AVESA
MLVVCFSLFFTCPTNSNIFYSYDFFFAGDELISPCMCKGTQQFVHRSCLDHWRSVKEGFAFSHCTTCKAQFHFRVETLEDNSWRKIKFRLFVARDVILGFLAVQITIAIISAIAYFLDRDGSFRNSFSDGWDRILSKHPIPFYYCIVEDLHGSYTAPKLEPEHEERLKMLKLM